MPNCGGNPYTLPMIEFVGGETQDLRFNVFFHSKDRPFGLSGVVGTFAIVSAANKTGAPVISKEMSAEYNTDDTALNVLVVTLLPEETVNLSGKYIYQITLRDVGGQTEIPKQGIMYIINNINKAAIR